jgi:2-octaprenyl-6-methoxyphenol hydroxylase
MSTDENQTPQQVRGSDYDVAIAGGGMVGMTLAIALAREGLRVAVIEKSPLPAQLEPSFDGRVSAIAAGSKNIFENIGVWDGMKAEAQPIMDIRVSDGATPFFLHYCHQEIGTEPFGAIVENRYIRHALQTVARALPNITILEKTSITGFEQAADNIKIYLSTQHSLLATLLIGADGKNSFVRKLANIGAVEWPYAQTAIVCTIGHEKPHDGLAQERFLPAGPFAVLPMTSIFSPRLRGQLEGGGDIASPTRNPGKQSLLDFLPPPQAEEEIHRSSLVWVEPNDRVKTYLDLPEEEFVQEIRERVGDYLGEITVRGKRFSYPLSVMHAKTYIGGRLALIGDAAHAIHPIAGQGVNLGFRDVAVLTELVAERFKLGLDIADAATLAHYQQWRRFDNMTMLGVTDGLNRLFSNTVIPIRVARNLGMWAVGKLPPVKRFFMRHAMGTVGDVPKLAKKQ